SEVSRSSGRTLTTMPEAVTWTSVRCWRKSSGMPPSSAAGEGGFVVFRGAAGAVRVDAAGVLRGDGARDGLTAGLLAGRDLGPKSLKSRTIAFTAATRPVRMTSHCGWREGVERRGERAMSSILAESGS